MVVMSYLFTRSKFLSLCVYTLVVIDVVLPALFFFLPSIIIHYNATPQGEVSWEWGEGEEEGRKEGRKRGRKEGYNIRV